MGAVVRCRLGMKCGLAWNQNLTYLTFTLLPVLMFTLVVMWNMKESYDCQILNIKWNLTRVFDDLKKSNEEQKINEFEINVMEDTIADFKTERRSLKQIAEKLKAGFKSIQNHAVDLTDQLSFQKIKLEKEQKRNAKLKRKINILQTKDSFDIKDPTVLPVDEKIVKAKDEIVGKVLAIKTKEKELNEAKEALFSDPEVKDITDGYNSNTEVSSTAEVTESTENPILYNKKISNKTLSNSNEESLQVKDNIVDKFFQIKNKEKELMEAKKELFSDTSIQNSDKDIPKKSSNNTNIEIKEKNKMKLANNKDLEKESLAVGSRVNYDKILLANNKHELTDRQNEAQSKERSTNSTLKQKVIVNQIEEIEQIQEELDKAKDVLLNVNETVEKINKTDGKTILEDPNMPSPFDKKVELTNSTILKKIHIVLDVKDDEKKTL